MMDSFDPIPKIDYSTPIWRDSSRGRREELYQDITRDLFLMEYIPVLGRDILHLTPEGNEAIKLHYVRQFMPIWINHIYGDNIPNNINSLLEDLKPRDDGFCILNVVVSERERVANQLRVIISAIREHS